jgi:hypothetical protein
MHTAIIRDSTVHISSASMIRLETAHADDTCCSLLLSVPYMHMHTPGMR